MIVRFAKNNKAEYTNKKPILFSDGFFAYIMAFILSIDKPRSLSSLVEFLNNVYGEEYLNRRVLKSEIEKYLNGSSLIRYSVSKEEYDNSIKSLEVKDFINAYDDIEIDQMLILFDDAIETKDFDSASKISISILNKEHKIGIYESQYLYLLSLNNNVEKVQELLNGIRKVQSFFMDFKIEKTMDLSDYQNRQLQILGITFIKDILTLEEKSISLFVTVLGNNYYDLCDVLIDLSSNIEDALNNVRALFNEKEIDILKKRILGKENGKSLTLNEIGEIYDVTRERIRQVESKAKRKIADYLNKNIYMDSYVNGYLNSEYFTEIDDNFKKNFSTLEDVELLCLMYSMNDNGLVYDNDYKIIYNSSLTSIEEIVKNIVSNIGIYIHGDDIEKLGSLKKAVINHNYRYKKDIGVFVLNGVSTSEFYTSFITKNIFPGGIHAGDSDDYKKYCKHLKDLSNDKIIPPTQRNLTAFLGRTNFTQVDRGTYMSDKYVAKLPQTLIDKILNYISKRDICLYSGIFDEFDSDLRDLGVNNCYYLKGLIDRYLPDEAHTTRNHISMGQEYISLYDRIASFIKSKNEPCTIDDIREFMPGVQLYTITNVIYGEIPNGLIWLDEKRFTYIDNLNIPNSSIERLKEYVYRLFEDLKSDVISMYKIYTRILIKDKELYQDLKLSGNSFMLFCIIRYFMPELYYSRPLISKNKNIGSGEEVIKDYISNFDVFNYDDIKKYTEIMSMRNLYSYLDFMEDMSDEYVQINIDTMAKKNEKNFPSNVISKVDSLLSILLKTDENGEIKTDKFKKYILFPKVKFDWNKYLLVGIIRSYLSEKYYIENTDSTYDHTDFIIRRIK